MFKTIVLYILNNIFKIKTQTTAKELNDNSKYANQYKEIEEINFNAIFSNKIANYVASDSTITIEGKNVRVDLLDKTTQSIWKNLKKITSMALGYGGIVIVPYVKGGKIYYNLVTQDRLTIDETDGELITGATILAEKREETQKSKTKIYLRWTNYQIKNNTLVITQQYSDEDGNIIPVPYFWKDIQEVRTITNVDRVPFGFIKSPINNRNSNDKYGVPITYGCESTINEIKEAMNQMQREYELKECFVGVDSTMFNKDNKLPASGLFKTLDTSGDDFFQIYDPAFRPYVDRLQELFRRLEHQIGTSAGIISEINTQNATATEIRRAMFDTFTIVDDTRANIEKAFNDLLYSMNVLANAYNLSAQGEYTIGFDWDYSLLEDSQETFSQLMVGYSNGVIKDVEVRQWLKPNETLEESQEAIDEIKAQQPSIEEMLGTKNE